MEFKKFSEFIKKTSNERFTEIISNFSYLSPEQAKAILCHGIQC